MHKLDEEGKGACSLSGLEQHLIDGIVLVPVNYVKPSEDGSVEPLPFLEKCIPNREWYILVTGTEEVQELHAFTVCPKWSVN